MAELMIRSTRLVRLDPELPDHPVDIRIRDGRISEIGTGLGGAEQTIEADGRWLSPGFWDYHVHFRQWAVMGLRFDTGAARCPEQVCQVVAEQVARSSEPASLLVGFGHRSRSWKRPVSAAELDAVSGAHPVVLITGDAHSGWINTAAQRLLAAATAGVWSEGEWFALMNRLDRLQADPQLMAEAVDQRLRQAARLGVVAMVDLVMDGSLGGWREVSAAGSVMPRIRVGVTPQALDEVEAAGYRDGDLLDQRGLVTMGPLKLICDGSLSSLTAYCHAPYGPHRSCGLLTYPAEELTALVRRGHRAGLQIACHAIGDAAATAVLDAFERVGASGSIEHAQLMSPDQIARMARLGLAASVQPAHLVDDLEALERLWADRADRAFPLRDLLAAGVTLRLGSDAPIAPLDPLAAMAAAVHRNLAGRPTWHPEQRLSVAEALAASVNGARVRVGAPADLVLLDADPLAVSDDSAAAVALQRLRPVSATIVAGEVIHQA